MSFIPLSLLLLHTVSAAPALVARDVQCPAANGNIVNISGKSFAIECNIDTKGGDMPSPNGKYAVSMDACLQQCVDRSGCQSVAWYHNMCYLKGSIPDRTPKQDVWGGILQVAAPEIPATTAAPAPAVTSQLVAPPKEAAAQVSTVAPAATQAPSSSGGCARPAAKNISKRGIPFADGGVSSLFSNKISWGYNWESRPSAGFSSNMMYIPMLWGVKDQSKLARWNSDAQAAIAKGADAVLGYNEPDHGEQASTDAATAAATWKQYMEPLKCQARLGAPAVTNGGAPMGMTWLKGFLAACSDCTIDFVPIHWYDSATNIQYFKNYVTDAYKIGGNRPIWITEFGANGSDQEVAAFFQEVCFFELQSRRIANEIRFSHGSTARTLLNGTLISGLNQALAGCSMAMRSAPLDRRIKAHNGRLRSRSHDDSETCYSRDAGSQKTAWSLSFQSCTYFSPIFSDEVQYDPKAYPGNQVDQ